VKVVLPYDESAAVLPAVEDAIAQERSENCVPGGFVFPEYGDYLTIEAVQARAETITNVLETILRFKAVVRAE